MRSRSLKSPTLIGNGTERIARPRASHATHRVVVPSGARFARIAIHRQHAETVETEAAADVPQEIIDHLSLREGWRDHVYLDSRGRPTAGMGHLLTAAERSQYAVGDSVPAEVLDGWARADARNAYDAALQQSATLGVSDARLVNALTAVNFQLGPTWNSEHRRTWAHLVAHEWEQAAVEAQDSRWYEQTPVRVQDFQAVLRSLGGTPKTDLPEAPAPPKVKFLAPVNRGIVTGSVLNVRKGPGMQYEKSGEPLTKGAAVVTYAEIDGWHCIGPDRWVYGAFVQLDSEIAKAHAAVQKAVDDYLLNIAQNVWDAMFGGTRLGTDEEKVYANLARLGQRRVLIERFIEIYQGRFGTDVFSDIRAEFSDSLLGNELARALGYLSAREMKAPPAKPAPGAPDKPATNRPARPSDPGVQMTNLLNEARTSDRPAGKCYQAIKNAIRRAGGYGDILDIYKDARFSAYQAAAIDFAAAVKANGAANLGLQEISGLPANAAAGTLLVIQGNGKQKLSQTYGDISVIEGVRDNLLVCYNDGRMRLPANPATWQTGNYAGVLLGMYQPVTRP